MPSLEADMMNNHFYPFWEKNLYMKQNPEAVGSVWDLLM